MGYAVAMTFWIFIALVAVAGIVADYKKRKLAKGALKAAIERGQQLDPAVIEKLLNNDRNKELDACDPLFAV